MKKVLSRAVLCALLTLAVIFTACKSPSSGGGGNSFNALETPLTLEAIDSGEITFDNLNRVTGLKYKINNNAPIEITENSGSKVIQVSAGDVVSIFAQGTSNTSNYSTNFRINCSSDCYIYGNVMSLLTDNYQTAKTIPNMRAFYSLFYSNTHIKNHPKKEIVLPATNLAVACYNSMFLNCHSLTKAPALPATTLAGDDYGYMFGGCTSLTQAPVLPAKALANYCYRGMFQGCISLTQAPALPATTLAEWCYNGMFEGCSSLTQAPVLPATTLANYCYDGMFKDCTKLTQAPALPATTLANYCYDGMFQGCTSLTQAPALPATTLANSCYMGMFSGCTSLTQAPALPATALAPACYQTMFNGCTSLNKITCLATNLSAASYTASWVLGVPTSGTFTKASGINWPRSIDGIPFGWTIVDYDKVSTPLTLEAIADGQITFNNLNRITNLKYKLNDGELTAATDSEISVSQNDIITFFGEGTNNTNSSYFTINCSSDCYVYGNVMSLLTEDYQTATEITQNYAFACLFHTNSHIKNHPSKNIVLPATTLAYGCYYGMFSGCTSLTQAPVLPAKALEHYCYDGMFYGCTSLNKVTCLATDLSADSCTDNWLSGVASSGTFTKASGTDWSVKTGTSGIPSGWAIQY